MESENGTSREVWLNYIGKLNDRAIHRERASGFTTWAVLGGIGILLAKSLSCWPIVVANWGIAVMALAGVGNCIFYMSALLLFSQVDDIEFKLASRLTRRVTIFFVFIVSVVSIFLCVLNFSAAILWPQYLCSWHFWGITGIMYMIFFLQSLVFIVRRWGWEPHKPELCFHASPNSVNPWMISCIMTLSISGIWPSLEAVPYIKQPIHVDLLIWSFSVVGTVILLVLFFFRFASRRQDVFLAKLERRIIFENLSADVIRVELAKELAGESIREWLERAEEEMCKSYKAFEQAEKKANKQFAAVSKIDRGMQIEIEGRRDKICDEFKAAGKKYVETARRLGESVKYLAEQRAILECPDLFSRISEDWCKQAQFVSSRVDGLCDVCKKATSDDKDKCFGRKNTIPKPNRDDDDTN